MRLRTLCLLFSCGLAGLGPVGAFAQQGPAAQGASIASLSALPAEIRAALGADIADRGAPFAAGCVSLHGEPHSRFYEARLSGDTARVTVERGGIAHYFDKLEFREVAGHWVALPHRIPQAPAAPPARTSAAAG